MSRKQRRAHRFAVMDQQDIKATRRSVCTPKRQTRWRKRVEAMNIETNGRPWLKYSFSEYASELWK